MSCDKILKFHLNDEVVKTENLKCERCRRLMERAFSRWSVLVVRDDRWDSIARVSVRGCCTPIQIILSHGLFRIAMLPLVDNLQATFRDNGYDTIIHHYEAK